MSVASAARNGVTFCLTVIAIFLVFNHLSGNSYNKHTQHYISLCHIMNKELNFKPQLSSWWLGEQSLLVSD